MVLDRDRLKSLVKISERYGAQSFSTLPVTLSGPAAFLGFTPLSIRLTSCSCTVSVWLLLQRGEVVMSPTLVVLTSKRAKKQLSCSATEVSQSAALLLLPL